MHHSVVKKALSHLKKDKILAKVIKNHGVPDLKRGTDYFGALVSSIIYQQITGSAAKTIENRFRKVLKNKITAQNVLRLKDSDFKNSGVSAQKMKYIRDLSTKFMDGTVGSGNFHKMTDTEVKNHLVAVKGIGSWTADMFLIFTLCRLDILPTGDLGIQKGFQKLFTLKKLPDIKKMERLATAWTPYRTFASWYLWRIADKEKALSKRP